MQRAGASPNLVLVGAAVFGFDALWLGLAGVSLLAAIVSAGLRRIP